MLQTGKWKKLLLAIFVLVASGVVLFVDVPSISALRHNFAQFGPWAWAVYFLVYVVMTQFPIPRSAFTIGAGVLFGPLVGGVLAVLATTVSAALSLTMLRSLVADPSDALEPRDSVLQRWARRQGTHPALQHVTRRLEQRGGVSVFFLRLIAGIPFSVLNYACVATPIKLRSFVVATFFGSAPSTFLGVLLGDTLVGAHDLRVVWLFGGLVAVGVLGLIVDTLVPVKSKA